MEIQYAQAFIDGQVVEAPITPSVIDRFETDMKMALSASEKTSDRQRLIWMAFVEAGATDLAYKPWLATVQAFDVREEIIPLETSETSPAGKPLPSPSNPGTDSALAT